MAARRSFHFAVSVTTRPARSGETDGVDYHFIDPDDFASMIRDDQLLEWAEFAGSRYGTPKEEVLGSLARGEDVVVDIEITGAIRLMEAFSEAVSIFVVPPSIRELESRMRRRSGMTEAQMATRLALAEEQLRVAPPRFDHVVLNEDLDETVDEIVGIINRTVPSPNPNPGTDSRY